MPNFVEGEFGLVKFIEEEKVTREEGGGRL